MVINIVYRAASEIVVYDMRYEASVVLNFISALYKLCFFYLLLWFCGRTPSAVGNNGCAISEK